MEARQQVEAALDAIVPSDAVEADHRTDALGWVRSGSPIWRTAKPATPLKHLVAYFPLVDTVAQSCLLVDHRLSGLWLPAGGHVEPGENPATTVARECHEELGFAAPLLDTVPTQPLFVTETPTVGHATRHLDVSLWYVCQADARRPIEFDRREFRTVRWWSFDELDTADPTRFDPHFHRFLAKLRPWVTVDR